MLPNDKLPKASVGNDLELKNSPVEFSFWPTKFVKEDEKESKELQFEIFCKEPWSVIEGEISKRFPKDSQDNFQNDSQKDANAFLSQSKEFYRAANGSGVISSPLLYYYSFLNLVKAQSITEGNYLLSKITEHGLSRSRNTKTNDLEDAYLDVKFSDENNESIFHKLLIALDDSSLKKKPGRLKIAQLLARVVAGHRLWKDTGDNDERFVPIYKNKFMLNKKRSVIWLNIHILKQDISRFDIKPNRLLAESGIGDNFKEVKNKFKDKNYTADEIICFEQKIPISYKIDSPDNIDSVLLNKIDSVIEDPCLKEKLWQVATSIPPYRKYYLYLRPEDDVELAQLPALYALFFYFGSVTRYRPSDFDKMRNSGDYRAFISDFFASQPEQFLNLFASEFCQRKVVKPAIP